jgi:outer membrane protein assembly factor BamA
METNELANKPKGGNALLLLNLEATFPFPIPLIPGYNLYYSIFADIGNVFEKVPDINLRQLERAIGFSLKIKTPLGPVWGSVAWNMAKNDFILSGGIGNVF